MSSMYGISLTIFGHMYEASPFLPHITWVKTGLQCWHPWPSKEVERCLKGEGLFCETVLLIQRSATPKMAEGVKLSEYLLGIFSLLICLAFGRGFP